MLVKLSVLYVPRSELSRKSGFLGAGLVVHSFSIITGTERLDSFSAVSVSVAEI